MSSMSNATKIQRKPHCHILGCLLCITIRALFSYKRKRRCIISSSQYQDRNFRNSSHNYQTSSSSFYKMTTYKIHAGDTFSSVANKLGLSLNDLLAANPGVKPEALQVGQVIALPSHKDNSSSHPSNPSKGIPGSQGGTEGGGSYVDYSGSASQFPNPGQWQEYSRLWDSNLRLMKLHDNDSETSFIKKAIETVARESGIDVRAILCVIMQESGGNVRVGSTNNGVRNPGIMQSHNGVSFNPSDPAGSILQMVKDGTEGTRSGDGLKQLYAKYGNYYEAFRGYNSGSVDKNNLNNPLGATQWYVRDIANRLMGHQWNGM